MKNVLDLHNLQIIAGIAAKASFEENINMAEAHIVFELIERSLYAINCPDERSLYAINNPEPNNTTN
ncbi:hypothetical protein [Thiothrix nivea]|uniref:Uncharacterized protein n=1 Tax=Thiothrix nivea (strain ATCC 35100 / DSM 5205 / JP2) TaxID=870187 RepID=A0A656HLQ5_THINJ|nr:hypothetical protein [Thiothrix nivea]EIJ36229.1 hypothetical protein Thini_3726 [Thiothrix nivea DSM 5205]